MFNDFIIVSHIKYNHLINSYIIILLFKSINVLHSSRKLTSRLEIKSKFPISFFCYSFCFCFSINSFKVQLKFGFEKKKKNNQKIIVIFEFKQQQKSQLLCFCFSNGFQMVDLILYWFKPFFCVCVLNSISFINSFQGTVKSFCIVGLISICLSCPPFMFCIQI